MEIVSYHVAYISFADGLCEVGLPKPLGKPHATGVIANLFSDKVCECANLASLIVVWQHRQNGLIASTGQNFYAAFLYKFLQNVDEFRMPLFKKMENTTIMQRNLDSGWLSSP